jgi:thioredoxin-like negative regulator of GroEL
LEVLIIDIRNNRKPASEHLIRVIPTMVLFNPAGKEVHRHQGFMSEEKVNEQLAKRGVV